MAPVGTIASSVSLNKTEFQGLNDPVTGNVSLLYRSSAGSAEKKEIFGPLTLSINLRCHQKLIVRENRTSHAYILHDERRQLFDRRVELFNGSFKAFEGEQQKYPFNLPFPQTTDPAQGRRGDLIPPSFHTRFRAEALKQAGHHLGQAWVEYSLRVQAEMPGIDVEILNTPSMIPIQYVGNDAAPSNAESKGEINQRLEIRSYDLLPEPERPSNILGKAKAALRSESKPTHSFNVICTSLPQVVTPGRSIELTVRVSPESQTSSQTDIALVDGMIYLLARTRMYATNEKGVDSPHLDHTATIVTVPIRRQGGGVFSKANDFTKTVSTDPLPLHELPCAFSIAKLERTYRLRIELKFSAAGQTAVFNKAIPVVVVAPAESHGSADAGPSRPRIALPGDEIDDENEDLPAYIEGVEDSAVDLHEDFRAMEKSAPPPDFTS